MTEFSGLSREARKALLETEPSKLRHGWKVDRHVRLELETLSLIHQFGRGLNRQYRLTALGAAVRSKLAALSPETGER